MEGGERGEVIRALLLSSQLLLPASALEAPRDAHMLNLSCVEALVSIDEARLAGAFSFVPEKDAPAAFADLVVHDRKALKKYVAKLDKDFKDAGGISIWDHESVAFAVSIYGSPLAQTLDKPAASVISHMAELAAAPTMTLEQLTAKRRKG
jgi:hypothetical protein